MVQHTTTANLIKPNFAFLGGELERKKKKIKKYRCEQFPVLGNINSKQFDILKNFPKEMQLWFFKEGCCRCRLVFETEGF